MEQGAKIFVAGHRGLAGSGIVRKLEKDGYTNLVLRTHDELDLMDQAQTREFFETEKPEYVFICAAKVGGVVANNTYPAEFIYNNLQIQNNIVHFSYLNKVKKLLILGSTCIYPRECPQPMKEEYLLTGPLEPTNEPYGIAKIAGIKMCQSYNRQYGTNFIAAMPTNLYGPNDNFDLETSHVIPALIRKFHEAKIDANLRIDTKATNGYESDNTNQRMIANATNGYESEKGTVEVWGTGKPIREFLHVDDCADVCVYLMNNFNPTQEQNERGDVFLNIGTGIEISIKELAELIKDVVGFEGEIVWNTDRPDGHPRKVSDVSRLRALGWKHTIDLKEGLERMYAEYKRQPQ